MVTYIAIFNEVFQPVNEQPTSPLFRKKNAADRLLLQILFIFCLSKYDVKLYKLNSKKTTELLLQINDMFPQFDLQVLRHRTLKFTTNLDNRCQATL
jgi:hypothetical protein